MKTVKYRGRAIVIGFHFKLIDIYVSSNITHRRKRNIDLDIFFINQLVRDFGDNARERISA